MRARTLYELSLSAEDGLPWAEVQAIFFQETSRYVYVDGALIAKFQKDVLFFFFQWEVLWNLF
jgi:hypothetical protein